jgi:hypothetical protein
LEDSAHAGDGRFEVPGLADGHGGRFFTVNVLACAGAKDGGCGVPAISGGNEHRVEVLSCQQFEHVLVHQAGVIPVMRIHLLLALERPGALHVAHGNTVDVLFRQHRRQHHSRARAGSDDAQNNPIGWRHCLPEA